jgi:CRP/FNR family transcriptional regulator
MTEGLAEGVVAGKDGRQILLRFFGPGDFIGASGLAPRPKATWSIVCVQPSSVMFFSREILLELMRREGTFAEGLLEMMWSELVTARQHLRDVISEGAPGRIRRYFERMAEAVGTPHADGVLIPGDISHRMVADSCGISRETVTRLLRGLRADGCVRQEAAGWIVRATGDRAARSAVT